MAPQCFLSNKCLISVGKHNQVLISNVPLLTYRVAKGRTRNRKPNFTNLKNVFGEGSIHISNITFPNLLVVTFSRLFYRLLSNRFLVLLKETITVTSLWARSVWNKIEILILKADSGNFKHLHFPRHLSKIIQGSFFTNLQGQHHSYMHRGDGANYLFAWPTWKLTHSLHHWELWSPIYIFKSETE